MKLYTPQECADIITNFVKTFADADPTSSDFMDAFGILQETASQMDNWMQKRKQEQLEVFFLNKVFGTDGDDK